MKSRKGLTRRSRLATLGAGSVALISTAAVAGTATMALSVLSRTNTTSTTRTLTLAPVVASAASLFSMSSSAVAPVTITPTVTAPTTPPSGAPAANRTQLGINLGAPSVDSGERAFTNLAAGSTWRLIRADNKYEDGMPEGYLTVDQEVAKLEAGEQVVRSLSVPNAAYLGQSVDIQCTWQGQATVWIDQNVARNIFITNNSAQFTWVPNGRTTQNVFFRNLSSSNPLKRFDCRETSLKSAGVFHPDFITSLKGYKAVRFVDWQNIPKNKTVRWATRTTANSGNHYGDDGVAVEHMVLLANQAQVDPWFHMPWNADDDYIRKFAEYVKANLHPSRRAYVELSNEVWNYGFMVAHQAKDEGVAANLDDNPYIAAGKRYSQKTRNAMAIWTQVFADQPNRLVRVIACQNANWDCARVAISFGDTAQYVDAIAVAPYFHGDFASDNITASNWTSVFTTLIPERLAWVRDRYKENQALANQYNKRLIAYEGGQHLTGNDVETMTKIQRDVRMGAAYTQYLRNWDKDVGDLMMLYNDVGVISRFGAWGMKEYVNQPAAQAPKYRAVMEFAATLPK
jgi:hypothetical protein